MSSIFRPPKMPSIQMPKITAPPMIMDEDTERAKKLLKRRKGKAETILTGDLAPSDITKKRLLGG